MVVIDVYLDCEAVRLPRVLSVTHRLSPMNTSTMVSWIPYDGYLSLYGEGTLAKIAVSKHANETSWLM